MNEVKVEIIYPLGLNILEIAWGCTQNWHGPTCTGTDPNSGHFWWLFGDNHAI